MTPSKIGGVPEWAVKRACDLTNRDGSTYSPETIERQGVLCTSIGLAFARYIAEHEEEPIDPMVMEARAALESMSWGVGGDNEGFIDRFVEALAKRGVSLTKEDRP